MVQELDTFLARTEGLERQVAHRFNLLMCCCMASELESRALTKAALSRNGFTCSKERDEREVDAYLARSAHRSVRAQPPRFRFYGAVLHAKFVASPVGYGRDCYRTWEALALGAVPVMLKGNGSGVDRKKFASLPVVWVDDWGEVTPQFLQERWREMWSARQGFDAKRAYFPYWLGRLTENTVGTQKSKVRNGRLSDVSA